MRYPYTRYHAVDGGEIDLEAGWILEKPGPRDRRFRTGELPCGRVGVTTHVGDYAKLPDAGKAIDHWLGRNNRSRAGPNWEVYRITWGQNEDPACWETDLYAPLVP